MAQNLLFIPDISGFTEFVNNTAVEHSHHIIAELLEELIGSNSLGLELAEVEGDALFFYREGDLPSMEELMDQVEKMTIAFHRHLQKYNQQRICQCGSCRTAVDLKLKFVAHAGPVEYIQVAGHRKPYGRDVIKVHRLLKNQVPLSEYFLVTSDLASSLAGWQEHSSHFCALEDSYDAGHLAYHYIDIGHLKDNLPQIHVEPGNLERTKPLVLRKHIDRPPADLFEVITNFKYRKLWNTEPQFVFDDTEVNRVGTQHVCIIDEKEVHFETVRKADAEQALVYGEKTRDFPFMEYVSTYFTVEANKTGSNVLLEIYLQPKHLGGRIFAPLVKTAARKRFVKLLDQLKVVAESKADIKLAETITPQ